MGQSKSKIIACKALPNYRVWIRFEDGLEGEVDLHDLVGKGIFSAWNSISYFNKVHVDPISHTLAWDEDIDLDPYVLRSDVEKNKKGR